LGRIATGRKKFVKSSTKYCVARQRCISMATLNTFVLLTATSVSKTMKGNVMPRVDWNHCYATRFNVTYVCCQCCVIVCGGILQTSDIRSLGQAKNDFLQAFYSSPCSEFLAFAHHIASRRLFLNNFKGYSVPTCFKINNILPVVNAFFLLTLHLVLAVGFNCPVLLRVCMTCVTWRRTFESL